jgi:hypothetical protein
MTAALHALGSPFGLTCLGLYAVAVVVLLLANHGAHRKPDPTWTDWTLSQPPVPTQAEVDAAWLADQPCAVDDDALCDAEFVSLISTTWQWPDTEDAA